MDKIEAHDEIKLKSPVEDIWKVLIDIPNYNKWWPKSVNLKILNYKKELVGTEFQANPLGGKSFSCRVVSILPMKEIRLDYFKGIYKGEGVWKIERMDGLVQVSYSVDLEITDKSIAFLSRIIPIPKLHSIIFKRILKGLEKEVRIKT